MLAGSIPESKSDYFLVREFSNTTHVATYSCDVWATMRRAMEAIFGQGNIFVEEELTRAQAWARRTGNWNEDWWQEQDEWPGVYGSDEGTHEIFRSVFKARELTGPDVYDWEKHYQISVTFNTSTRQFGIQSAFIDDGGDVIGDGNDEWIPRASMLRNQQLLRIWYDSYQYPASRPVIMSRDADIIEGETRTRRTLGKRDDLYPLKHEDKDWSHRCDRDLHLRIAHDDDFTVLWDSISGDCVAFDFREHVDEAGCVEAEGVM